MKRRDARFALVAAVAALTTAAAMPASAQEDTSLTASILSGLGLVAPETPDIEYRERAPLVVPPSGGGDMMLPPPRNANAVANNPAWPKDYDDEQARKRKAEEAVVDKKNSKQGGLNPAPLSPTELNKGWRSGKASGSGFNPDTDNRLSPNQLGFTGWGSISLSGAKEKPLVFTGEPEREALVQPPPGYQTPAPNAPYGVVEQKKQPWSLPDLFDRTQANK